jgi:hypothetical protein
MAPSAVVRFKSRGKQGVFPAEPIAVPRNMLTIEFAELLPKLLAEFWPAVRDDVEDVPAETVRLPPPPLLPPLFGPMDRRSPSQTKPPTIKSGRGRHDSHNVRPLLQAEAGLLCFCSGSSAPAVRL